MIARPGNGVNATRRSASWISELRASMTITNSIGEMGSLCLNPRACIILLPCLPFRSTLVLAVDRRIKVQFVHRRGKRMCYKTSSRNGQATKLKAFAMSTFSNTEANFLLCSQRHANCTALKLSWIDRSLMKALWLGTTISLSLGAIRLARHLANSLLKLCIRLIGL